MSASFYSNGNRRLYTNTSSAIASKSVVVLRAGATGEIGIAMTDIDATTGTGEVQVSGEWTLPAATGAITAHALVYWSGTAITTTASGNTLAGVAVAAKTTAATSVVVLLNSRTSC